MLSYLQVHSLVTQQQYLYPAVRRTWMIKQLELIENLKRDDMPLILGEMAERTVQGILANNHILDIQLVRVDVDLRAMKSKEATTWRLRG